MSKTKEILARFEMDEESGLVFTSSPDTDNPVEILALDEAERFGATAVYFRRFPESGQSVPQVYIYEREFSDDDLIDTHRKLWSSGVVPLFYVVTDTQVKIFSCTKKAEENSKDQLIIKDLESFVLANAIQESLKYQRYSARLFDNGTFWEQERNRELLDLKNTPYEILLKGLIRARKRLEQQKEEIKITDNTISKLLIMGILVKYLEEKQDNNGERLLEIYRDFYNQFSDSKKFTDVLRNGHSVSFFEKLSQKFNGKIFHLNDNEKNELAQANLRYVANFFDSTVGPQGQLIQEFINWKLYSFNHLPIELISGIYEAFLNTQRSDIVYTPPFLVNFLIDECMPIQKAGEYFQDEIFKVLDPSCGSGIFLVSALKRMVQWKAILNFEKTKKIEYPDVETIKRIIRNNIFGVDIEQEATLITIFSLSIALCDKLTPMQIWDNLRFDDLSQTNIQQDNFFGFFNKVERGSFDLVIGNPPFNTPNGEKNSNYYKQLNKDYQTKASFPIQDQNLALLFWDRAVLLCKPKKTICLILPSGTWLYNNNSLEYRSHFLQSFDIKKIFDFTHLSDTLFHGSANVAVCAVKAINGLSTRDDLLHIIVKRTNVSEKRKFFELDHYDYHTINYDIALNNSFVWKANLLGGKRLLRLINRLSSLRNLEEFLLEKKKDGWFFGEGYKIGHDNSKTKDWLEQNNFKKAEWITSKETLIVKSFTDVDKFETSIEQEEYFERNRNEIKSIFKPPHLLIKKIMGEFNLPIIFSNDYLTFKNEVIGIYSSNENELRNLYEKFIERNGIYRFFLFSISSRSGINKSHTPLYTKDLMELPFPVDEEDLTLGYSEGIIVEDVLEFFMKSGRASNNSPLNQSSKPSFISEYSEIFCKTLNPIYASNNMRWEIDGIAEIEETLSIVVFRYGLPKETPVIVTSQLSFQMLSKLIYNQHGDNVRITRVFRAYLNQDGYDLLVLVKPNLMRYWLKSIALRDADETFADLKHAGF